MHSFPQWFLSDLIPAFGRTLVHSLWQGLAAAVLAGIVIACTRRLPAVKRYNGLLVVYALFLLTVAATFFYEIGTPATAAGPAPSAPGQPSAIVFIGNITTGQTIDEGWGSRILSLVNQHAVLMVSVWVLLFLAQLTRMAFGLRYVQTVKRGGTIPVESEWTEWIAKASRTLGIRQPVRLLQSQRVKIPVVLGYLKPVVLVPIGLMTRLNTQQVEAVLLHELAHIRRHDYLVNLLQSVADAVFFFNPGIKWISARIREERESCCDSIVLQHTANTKGYVEALVSFSDLPLSSSYAMALGSRRTHLLNRVKTIISRENSRLTAREQATLLLGMVLLAAFGAFAFTPKEKAVEKERPKELFIEQKPPVLTKIVSPATQTKVVQKVDKQVPPKLQADTIPPPVKKEAPKKWKSLNTNINDDGEGKTSQVIATHQDGTVYRIRKINDKVVSIMVNDREVPKEEYPNYFDIVTEIELVRKLHDKRAKERQQRQIVAVQRRQEATQKEREERQERQEKRNLERKKARVDTSVYNLRRKFFEKKNDAFMQKLENYKKVQLVQNKKQLALNQKQQLYNQKNIGLNSSPQLSAIIADLVSNKMVESDTKLSFTLNNQELVVNGKAVDKGTFEIFRKKYIRNSGDSFSYFREGGTTRTNVNIQ